MTAIEMKYSLFRDIDSINDESVLYRLTALVKSMLFMPYTEQAIDKDDSAEIPEFVRNMSVKTGIPGNVDAKELMHQHWEEIYGKGNFLILRSHKFHATNLRSIYHRYK